MGFLDNNTLQGLGNSAVSSLTNGIVSGSVGSLFSGINAKRTYKYQKKLLQDQYNLNEQAAQNQDARTRDLMLDQGTIQKQSNRDAGMNVAFNGNAAQVSGVTAATQSPASVPSVSDFSSIGSNAASAAAAGASLPLQFKQEQVVDEQHHLIKSQADNQDIKNLYEASRQFGEIRSLFDKHQIDQKTFDMLNEQYQRLVQTHGDFIEQTQQATKQAQLQSDIMEFQKQQEKLKVDYQNIVNDMSREQLKQLQFITEHQLERFNLEKNEILSRTNLNNKNADLAVQQALLVKAQALGQRIQNQLEEAKIPYASEIAYNTTQLLINDVNLRHAQGALTQAQHDKVLQNIQTDKYEKGYDPYGPSFISHDKANQYGKVRGFFRDFGNIVSDVIPIKHIFH